MNNGVAMKVNLDDYILSALKEDISYEDITTNAILRSHKNGTANLICKEDGVLAGVDVFRRVFELLDRTTEFECFFKDGDPVKKGQLIGVVSGDARTILSGERTALNYLQRMSGVATYTQNLVKELDGYNTKLLDTRKTTPNMRIFEKYAVKIGGGFNHRYNLSDGVLIKDNHIEAAGGVKEAIMLAKEYAPFVKKIEVEVENLVMLDQALEAGADIIMLDNMDDETIKKAIDIVGSRAETECSGNITRERIKKLAELGVDYISVGALTHSAPILDFSLKGLLLM
jgi:nicotinate-nucleotide pyrophosphorylase (carboxylating)